MIINCPICDPKAEKSHKNSYKCSLCGECIIPEEIIDDRFVFGIGDEYKYNVDHLSKYLYYNKKVNKKYYIGSKKGYENAQKQYTNLLYVSPLDVENWYPKTFADKIDLILLKLYNLTKYLGEDIKVPTYELYVLFFIYSDSMNINIIRKQEHYIYDYLKNEELIVGELFGGSGMGIFDMYSMQYQLTPKALNLIYALQKNAASNINVFVAMSFHKSANEIRGAIKQGIIEAGFSSLFMNEIIHNHQIVPEMLRLIKESRFIIMDISQPNFGAYYEAGYAQGLGKEVIITCSQQVWNNKDYSCELNRNCSYKAIASKPHFDIAQKQILVWDSYDDLTKKLKEWIKYIIV